MSGMIPGTKTSPSRSALLVSRSSPSARSVPIAVAMIVEIAPMMIVLAAEPRIFSSVTTDSYQRVEKPVQAVGRPESLKDRGIRTGIGGGGKRGTRARGGADDAGGLGG